MQVKKEQVLATCWNDRSGFDLYEYLWVKAYEWYAYFSVIAAIPLILYGFGAKRVTLASSGMILTLIPIINIAAGAFILGEHVTFPTGVSILIIVVAVVYYTFNNFRENGHA